MERRVRSVVESSLRVSSRAWAAKMGREEVLPPIGGVAGVVLGCGLLFARKSKVKGTFICYEMSKRNNNKT